MALSILTRFNAVQLSTKARLPHKLTAYRLKLSSFQATHTDSLIHSHASQAHFYHPNHEWYKTSMYWYSYRFYLIFIKSYSLLCDTTRARYEDGMVCSAVYGYLRCALVYQQSAGYGHNECGYRCGVVRLPVRDTSEHWGVHRHVISGYRQCHMVVCWCHMMTSAYHITMIGRVLMLSIKSLFCVYSTEEGWW